jgi:tetratricopeptide (TPR) repeat protein
MKTKTISLCFILSMLFSGFTYAEMTEDVIKLQKRWAQIKYEIPQDQHKNEFDKLLVEAETILQKNKLNPESLMWHAVIEFSYANAFNTINPFALHFMNNAKNHLEEAIIFGQGTVLGLACTRLGTLYYKVSSSPLGFGDNDKAEMLLKKGLEINPKDIDANFFFADFLVQQGEYNKANTYLEKAKNASPRMGMELADQSRQKEIERLIQTIGKS